jgi:hypothetical protein
LARHANGNFLKPDFFDLVLMSHLVFPHLVKFALLKGCWVRPQGWER